VKKKIFKILLFLILVLFSVFFLYFNNTRLVSATTASYYTQLKSELKRQGLSAKLLVVSTKRFKWHNQFQVKTAGAASKSRHLSGDALDFIVFDVNRDGSADHKDVEIVYDILNDDIIGNKGGIGTYKDEKAFFYRQMIHIDARGHRARWTK
jgi:uncharacterized protein YcbK (DUF882 family)